MAGHTYRMNKVRARLDFLKKEYGIAFPEEELERLFAMDNPGKPHIGNLMVKYGFARSEEHTVPGKSQGQQSLVGCSLWHHTESDMT